MKSKPSLNQEDSELFRKSVGKVYPVVVDTAQIEMPVRRRQIRQSTSVSMSESPGSADTFALPEEYTVTATDAIQFRRSGVQDRVFRKLRKGQLRIGAELDLHGVTANKARQMLDSFMARIKVIDNQSCIRIIHGKGYGSKDSLPVIKMNIQHWLQCNDNVLAYCSCKRSDGGTGAIYVLLKVGG
jgi:DNA-nicking Smr family endonuclease